MQTSSTCHQNINFWLIHSHVTQTSEITFLKRTTIALPTSAEEDTSLRTQDTSELSVPQFQSLSLTGKFDLTSFLLRHKYECNKQKIRRFILHALGALRCDHVIATSFSELSLLIAMSYLDMSSYNCCSNTRQKKVSWHILNKVI